MAIRLSTTRDSARDNGAKFLVHGPSGAGKTVLCGTTGAPTVIISAEAGCFLWGTLPGASIIAFRVTKPAPPKPREWFVSGGNCLWDTYTEAYNACDRGEKPIHVREVLPE